jgi:hypothetical protein
MSYDPEDMMPVGDCCVCGEYLDHLDMGNCENCGGAFHWNECGGWGGFGENRQLCSVCKYSGEDQ